MEEGGRGGDGGGRQGRRERGVCGNEGEGSMWEDEEEVNEVGGREVG